MSDAGTLATTAQVLLSLGENAGDNQILEANTNYAILQAESLISSLVDYDLVTNYATFTAYQKQALALCASSKAAMILINQNQNSWGLATAQSKLNVLDSLYKESIEIIKNLTE